MTVELKIKNFALHAECLLFIEHHASEEKESAAKWKDRINQKRGSMIYAVHSNYL